MSYNSTDPTTIESPVDLALQDEIPLTTFITIVIPIIYFLVCLFGLVGNFFVIVAMLKLQKSIRISDFLIVNLAIADLMLVCSLPFWAAKFALMHAWIFGEALCKLVSWITMIGRYGSTYFIAIMALDRLAAVIFNAQTKRFRVIQVAYGISAGLWLFALAISSPAVVFRMTVQDNSSISNPEYCKWNFNSARKSDETWYYVQLIGFKFIIGFTLPLLVISVCYVAIITYIKRRKSQKRRLRNKQNKITNTIIVVIIVFVVCWLPNEISTSIYTAQAMGWLKQPEVPNNVHDHIQVFSNLLIWCHCCVNPFLYAFMRDDVKKKLYEMLGCLRPHCCQSIQEKQKKTENNELHLLQNAHKNRLDEECSSQKSSTHFRLWSNLSFSSKKSRPTQVSVLISTEINPKTKQRSSCGGAENMNQLKESKEKVEEIQEIALL